MSQSTSWININYKTLSSSHPHTHTQSKGTNAGSSCLINCGFSTLTQHHHDRLDQLDGRPISVDRAAGVRHQHRRPSLDVGVDPHVDGHHHQEDHQVGHGPEDQVAPAEDGGQLGAVAQVADAVPAQTGHCAHENGDGPHRHDQQGHPPLRQVAMHFPVHHGDVALQGDDEQVCQRRRQADVQEALADQVSLNGEGPGHLARVKHEVDVRYAGQEVRGGETGQEIVKRVVKPLVGDDGSDDHGVGQQDEAAEEGAHHPHQDELRAVPFIAAAAVVVEEAHRLTIVTAEVRLGHCWSAETRERRGYSASLVHYYPERHRGTNPYVCARACVCA